MLHPHPQPPNPRFIGTGYCGADIKSICAEAALCALRRRYPQIYTTSEKLQLDLSSINISAKDFEMAMQKIIPASQRAVASPGQALSAIVKPLLQNTVHMILEALQKVFPHVEVRTNKDLNSGIKLDWPLKERKYGKEKLLMDRFFLIIL